MPDKVAIITAASQGIGAACAKELKGKNYELVLFSRSEKILQLAEDLNVKGMQGDISSRKDLEHLVDFTLDNYGRIDGLVNNTGHVPKGELLEISDENWHQSLDMILLNVTRLAQMVVPEMLKVEKGSIVNISTFAAYEPSLTFPISSVLRAALGSYTKLFAERYASQGIRMNSVLPGYIDSYPLDKEGIDRIPLKRQGSVNEIAKTVSFLLSEDAGYITGQNIRVDGGITRSV